MLVIVISNLSEHHPPGPIKSSGKVREVPLVSKSWIDLLGPESILRGIRPRPMSLPPTIGAFYLHPTVFIRGFEAV